MQKIVVCNAHDAVSKIQPLLDKGFTIIHCVAENVAVTDSSKSGTWASGKTQICGEIVFILNCPPK